MDTLDAPRVNAFFASLLAGNHESRPAALLVTHLLPDRPFLVEALAQVVDLRAIIPKPKTANPRVRSLLSKDYEICPLTRDEAAEPAHCLDLLNRYGRGDPMVLIDIGGYFAPTLNHLRASYAPGLIGVVEDTENGHQKYERASPACPVISVARSPLKNPEDFLVGQSIVFSTEALLRGRGDIIHGRTACVLGYGKIGRSIANLLNARYVRTVVFDIDPIKSIEAMSHGFSVAPSLEHALKGAGLVFCATGNHSIKEQDFTLLGSGSYIATVTSSEDEIELHKIRKTYTVKHVTDYVTRYKKGEHHFYVLNRGQAVNFVHGAAVGPFIYLIQGEIVASVDRLKAHALAAGLQENSTELRQSVATKWLSVFGPTPFRGS